MTILKHELRQGRTAFWIWSVSIGFLLAVCVCLFPEMKGEMAGVSKIFSAMGAFTAAFGMDKLNFGTMVGYYAIECGNVLGLGGAFYAALCGVDILSKEEGGRTAEFLLTHPVTRARILTEKLLSVFARITALNVIVYVISAASIIVIKEPVPWKELNLLHLAYYLLGLEMAGICFGISAFQRKGSAGTGLGIAAIFYFLNLVVNISKSARVLKYLTPFGYCDGADIVSDGKLNAAMVAVGAAICVLSILAAFRKYLRKDIQ